MKCPSNIYYLITLKSITYRLLATCETIFISYLLTNDIKKGLQIGMLDTSVKFISYYLHEWLWLPCLHKNSPPLEQISIQETH